MSSKPKRQSMIGGNVMLSPAITEAEPMEVDENELIMSDDEEGGTRIGDIYIPPPVKPYCSTESIGPRLIITHITNNNFKSYAGEVSLGPFFNRFHAIIGPNGSGKSNVIDSMLFVFGYRANKIRCKKLSVLLHKSAKFNDVTSCRVAVHFAQILDKPDGTYDKIPNTEFYISRTAYADNSSFYTIGEKRVHFKEVAKLLKSHNVDLDHNRFLILQGEVESIAMMKAKAQTPNECGLLEYLEDIIGTSRYKEPLMQINNRVEALTEERTDKHNRCKLAEREMNDLKQPMEEAVEYLKLENELTRSKNLHAQINISDRKKDLQVCEEKHKELSTQLQDHDSRMADIKKERIEKEAIIKKELENFEQLTKKKEEYQSMAKKAINEFTEIQTSMEATNKRRKTLKTQLKKEEENLVELRKVPEKNATEITECEKKIEKLTKQKDAQEEQLQANLESLQNEIRPLIEKKEQFETKLMDLQVAVDESKAALTLSESELKICKENETSERRKYETLQSALIESRQSLQGRQSEISGHEENIPALRASLETKNKELQANKAEEQELSRTLNSQRTDMEEKSRAMQATRSNNKVLDALMKQKMEGKIPGVLGRLGDLGGIDAKYDVAISTCCSRLDNIVVDTINTAQTCIEYLKRADAGRGTFIALEKVAHYAARAAQPIKTPENAHRLFDLIRVEDPRISPAFYFSLSNTLVANDLDQATRIAYGATRFRVVSLQGDVIEMSGTMSGGGRSQMRGRMGQTVKTKTSAQTGGRQSISNADLDRLNQVIMEQQERLNYVQEIQGHLERDIVQINNSIKQKEKELQRMRIDITSLSQQLPHMDQQVQNQKKKMDATRADPEVVRKIEADIENNKKTFEKSQNAAKKIIDQVSKTQQQINDITSDKVKSLEKTIDDMKKQIAKLSKNVSKLKVEVSTSERNVTKTETKIANIEEEIKNAEEALLSASAARKTADEDSKKLQELAAQMDEEIRNASRGSSSIKKEIDALEKQETEGKLKRIEFDESVRDMQKKITAIQERLPVWRNVLLPLKLNIIPNEEEQQTLKTYTEEELATYKLADLTYKISVQEDNLSANKPNLSVIADYFKKREVYLERVQVLEDITKKRNEMRQLHDDVRKKRYTEFMQGFNIITKKLKEMYQMITQGGDAELELVDSMDPFSEGVAFSVRPPKKSWKNISNLSGGEKTLSSLALVFALHYYKPSPLYFMDEIDAALDFRNVSIVANYIKARTKNAQFIIISLRSNMFELADYLSGIYKVEDCTQSVTIQNVVPTQMLTSSQSTQQMSNGHDGRPLSQMFDKLKSTQDFLPALEANIQMEAGVDETIYGGNIDSTINETVDDTALDATDDETIDGGVLDSTVEDTANVTVVETANRRNNDSSTSDEDMLAARPIVVSVSADIHAPPEDTANVTVVETANRRHDDSSTSDEDMLAARPIVVSVSADIHAPPEAYDNDMDIDR